MGEDELSRLEIEHDSSRLARADVHCTESMREPQLQRVPARRLRRRDEEKGDERGSRCWQAEGHGTPFFKPGEKRQASEGASRYELDDAAAGAVSGS